MKRRPDLPPAARGRLALRLTAAAALGRFRLPVCDACGAVQYPPREICRDCLGEELTWRDITPGGTIQSVTVLAHSLSEYFKTTLPLYVASIRLDAGSVAVAHLADPALGPGDRVRVFARLDRSGQGVLGAIDENSEEERLPMPDPNGEITGKTVLVTGATGGIGTVLLRAVADAGAAKVLAAARDPARIDSKGLKGVEPIALDVTDPGSVESVAAAHGASVDILINNAGVNGNQPLLDPDDPALARAEMDVNYFGTLAMIRAFAPAMKARKQGVIVNMLTILSHVNLPLMGSYCASKAALLSLTEGARAELTPWGVRVVGIFPGAVDTEMSRDFPPPKLSPRAVATGVVDALTGGIEDAFIGPMAQDLHTRLEEDRKAVEKELAGYLPEPR